VLLDIAMMRRPWVVGVEVPGEGIGEGTGPRSAEVSASDCGSEGSNPIRVMWDFSRLSLVRIDQYYQGHL